MRMSFIFKYAYKDFVFVTEASSTQTVTRHNKKRDIYKNTQCTEYICTGMLYFAGMQVLQGNVNMRWYSK